nr:immunoglobulin heavy chain junction region [Mus musculus]MBK4189340.1 immunoglobulin heavy chain junction region [Mus musculus]MBK4189341.1 immunoglobulin heavy chain junction region [Mus musculus]MBK4189342.1 immunoglobulin heavy chain junction region [Mus musculus]MBK4189344.1 immunoglobulin heavy chain junction region [Mus musculus]
CARCRDYDWFAYW